MAADQAKTEKLDRVRATAAAAAESRTVFEAAIRDAHPVCTVREIAAASGLSRSRVGQIIEPGGTR